MHRKEPCPRCGTPKDYRAKNCRVCFSNRVEFQRCKECGARTQREGGKCRACWRKQFPDRSCKWCGGSLDKNSGVTVVSCGACRERRRLGCVECGKEFGKGTKRGSRCWDCWNAVRQSKAAVGCSIPGCHRPHGAKGMCKGHYRQAWRREHPIPTLSGLKAWIGAQPCQICGYNRIKAEVHRPVAGGPYTLGNMTALCANCHKEVHRGLAACPEPLYPPGYAHVGT